MQHIGRKVRYLTVLLVSSLHHLLPFTRNSDPFIMMPSRYFWIPRLQHWLKSTFAAATATPPPDVVEEKDVVLKRVLNQDDVPTRLPCSLVDTKLVFQGYWDALFNMPRLFNCSGVKGNYYIVGREGATMLDGRNQWRLGCIVVFDGTWWQMVQVEISQS